MSAKSLASKLAGQHAKIIDAIGSPTRIENRRARRNAHRTHSQILPCVDGRLAEAVSIQLQDFSTRGLGFHAKARMTRGQQFVFDLPRTDNGTTPVLCTVAYCRKSSDTEFRVGAEFTCVVRKDQFGVAPTDADLDRIKRSILD